MQPVKHIFEQPDLNLYQINYLPSQPGNWFLLNDPKLGFTEQIKCAFIDYQIEQL